MKKVITGLWEKIDLKIDSRISKVSAIIFMLLGWFYDVLYVIKYGETHLDSDMAAEMVLSDILNKSHEWIASDFYYSTELRVIFLQIFYRITLLFSPNNWHLARILGMAIALAVMAFSIVLVSKVAHLEKYCYWNAAIAMWPLGFWYCWLTACGGAYITFAILSFLSMYFVLKLRESKGKKRILNMAFLIILAFVTGLQGVRLMMIFYAPLLLACIFVSDRKSLLPQSICAFLANGLGWFINIVILSKHYVFNNQAAWCWGGGSGSWITTMKWFFDSFGYCQDPEFAIWRDGPLAYVFSFEGISEACGLLLGMAVLASSVYLLVRYKKLQACDQIIVAFCFCLIFVNGFVFTYVHGAKQYWLPVQPFGYSLLVLAIKNLHFEESFSEKVKEMIKTGSFLIMACAIAIASKGTVDQVVNFPIRANTNLPKVVEWLEANTDFSKGIGEFWNCDVLTELSDGKIEMYAVVNPAAEPVIYQSLQRISHKDSLPQNHYFIILNESEDLLTNEYLNRMGKLIYRDNGVMIFGVD